MIHNQSKQKKESKRTSRQIGRRTKVVSLEKAVSMLKPGQTLLSGGFGVCGLPESLIEETIRQEIGGLTVVSSNAGVADFGIGLMLEKGLVKRMVGSYIGANKTYEKLYLNGQVELELTPQGTLAEKLRSGGKGIPAFWTKTGVDTVVESGGFPIKLKSDGSGEPEILAPPKRVDYFKGKFNFYNFLKGEKYLMEETITGDLAFVKAYKGDTKGNLHYRMSARNFNPDMATAAKIVIAEVEHIVEPGEIGPEEIHTPGVYVDYIVQSTVKTKPIENLVLEGDQKIDISGVTCNKRLKIAKRVAMELKDGTYVNLGVGIPTLVPAFKQKGVDLELQCENGVLGLGGYVMEGEADPDLINAGKETIRLKRGASFFSSSDSFGMIRGAHLDTTVLGAMQVSATGDIANWIIPGKLVKGMGGAMDLVACGSRVIAAMEHVTKKGLPKIMEECSLPLTGKGVLDMVITDMAVFDYSNEGRLTLKEIAEGYTLDDIKKVTNCDFETYSEIGRF